MKKLKRAYSTQRMCKNPVCDHYFIPTHKSQVYCCRQCQINCNNDKKNKDNELEREQKKLERSDLLLEDLYYCEDFKSKSVSERILRFKGVDLTIGILGRHPRNGEKVRLYIHFALWYLDDMPKEYFIVTREEVS
jgi:hypothetical protein